MKLRIATITAAIMFACVWPASAVLVNYTVEGNGPQQFPGSLTAPVDAFWGPNGYPGDTIELATYTGSFDLALGTSVQKINTLLWAINYTYGGSPEPWPDMNLTVNANRKMSIDGGLAILLNQTGNLRVNYENDYLGFAGGATATFLVQGYRVDVTPLGFAEVGGSYFDGGNPWPQPNKDMMAEFVVTLDATAVVPEPSTYLAGALLLLPFGASMMRKLRKA